MHRVSSFFQPTFRILFRSLPATTRLSVVLPRQEVPVWTLDFHTSQLKQTVLRVERWTSSPLHWRSACALQWLAQSCRASRRWAPDASEVDGRRTAQTRLHHSGCPYMETQGGLSAHDEVAIWEALLEAEPVASRSSHCAGAAQFFRRTAGDRLQAHSRAPDAVIAGLSRSSSGSSPGQWAATPRTAGAVEGP